MMNPFCGFHNPCRNNEKSITTNLFSCLSLFCNLTNQDISGLVFWSRDTLPHLMTAPVIHAINALFIVSLDCLTRSSIITPVCARQVRRSVLFFRSNKANILSKIPITIAFKFTSFGVGLNWLLNRVGVHIL